MTAVISKEGTGFFAVEIDGVASTANAGQGSIANPWGHDVFITRAYIITSVISTGSANLGIGITTAAAKGTDILNDLDMNGVTVDFAYNGFAIMPTASTVLVPAVWTSALFLTFTGSATMAGFKGTLYLETLPTTVENT